MRIIFMGTPDFAIPTLNALVDAGHQIVAVFSQPPRPAGRGKADRPSAVHARALELGLRVRTPVSLKGPSEAAAFFGLQADVAVVAAYGLLLPRSILSVPPMGCLNVHGSILPRWRGAAPVQRAILAGDAETGVTIMQMDVGLDTGDMRAIWTTPVDRKTAGMLTDELAQGGAELMVRVLATPDAFPPMRQPELGVTYATKIDKAESRLDLSQDAVQVERQVRAFNPAPGAWIAIGGERIKILAADVAEDNAEPGTVIDDALLIACGRASIRPTIVQRAGKGAMATAEMLRGLSVAPGTRIDAA